MELLYGALCAVLRKQGLIRKGNAGKAAVPLTIAGRTIVTTAVIYGGSGHQRAPFLPFLFLLSLAKSVVADNGSPWLP